MIASRLQDIWYGDRQPGLLLNSLEGVYRRSLESRRSKGLAEVAKDLQQRPIVVVGNITAGGTGKTPLVIRLCELLRTAGLKPGVVSRGYGRQGRGQLLVTGDSEASESGDEPLMIATRCQVPVVVDSDREAATRELFRQDVDIAISDDGLQRWRLPRDIEICVMDAERGFGNGRLLPAGPLREPVERIQAVDYLVSNGGPPAAKTGREALVMEIRANQFVSLDGDSRVEAATMHRQIEGHATHALAGIGSPQRFFDTLAKLGIKPDHLHSYPDHHAFGPGDFADKKGVLLMTEKDAIKCRELSLENAWYLQVDALMPSDWEQRFCAQAQELVRAKAP